MLDIPLFRFIIHVLQPYRLVESAHKSAKTINITRDVVNSGHIDFDRAVDFFLIFTH